MNNFYLLDEELEESLKKVYELTGDGFFDTEVSTLEYSKRRLSALENCGYIALIKSPDFNNSHYMLSITQWGLDYFKNKDIYLKEQKKKKRKDNFRFGITIFFTAIAAVCSAITLFKH